MKTSADTAMIAYVTGVPDPLSRVSTCGFTFGIVARCSLMHSGQKTPTAPGVWHSGQMVRPHRWQSTKLWRSGCR
jgi:hypothetical protein